MFGTILVPLHHLPLDHAWIPALTTLPQRLPTYFTHHSLLPQCGGTAIALSMRSLGSSELERQRRAFRPSLSASAGQQRSIRRCPALALRLGQSHPSFEGLTTH